MEPVDLIWMNGDFVPWEDAKVHVLTHGLHYGSGVFEGVRAYETSRGAAVFRLDDHIRRLFRSAHVYLMDIPFTQEELSRAVKDTIRANHMAACYIRPLVYRGYAFVRLADRFGPYVTVVATSSLFALLHLQSGVPWLSVLAGVLTSGLVFGAIFARWRSVPLALGFHVATNIVQDASGLRTSAASLFAPAYPPSAADSSTRILVGIALVNVLLAAGILGTTRWPRSLQANER